MGTVYRKTITRNMPPGAEVFTRKGDRFARWKDKKGKTRTASITEGKDGSDRISVESPYFIAKYRDGNNIVVEQSTGCRHEDAARRVLADLERRAELIRSGVMSNAEAVIARHQATPLTEHFAAFDTHLQAKEATAAHRAQTASFLRRMAADCSFGTLADLRREPFEKWLAARTGEGMAAKTRNAYHTAIVAFCHWCIAANRLTANPFRAIPKANAKADPRRQRRSMTEEELTRLLAVARERPLLDALTVRRGKRKGERYANVRPVVRNQLALLGRERALIYKALVLTGLRKGELASLTVGQLHLGEPVPFASLDAADEKNREGNDVPLRNDLANDLRDWLSEKLERIHAEALKRGEPIPARLPADTPVFTVPAGLLRILNRDLKLAGIPKRDERGRTLDVHALRTTFGTLLSKGGVAPRTAQAAMRHSDIKLTMQVYTDPKLLDVAGALNALPALPLDSDSVQSVQCAQATGTEGRTYGPMVKGVQQSADSVAPLVAPTVAPTTDKASVSLSIPDKVNTEAESHTVAVSGCPDKKKGSLAIPVSEPSEWALRDSNPRPHGCDPCALTS
jgi:integrase